MQFVNFTEIMSKKASSSEKEAAFALAALMEIPLQYKAAIELGLLGWVPCSILWVHFGDRFPKSNLVSLLNFLFGDYLIGFLLLSLPFGQKS